MSAPQSKQPVQPRRKAAIYVRVSTMGQKIEGFSPEAQFDMLRDYAANKNFEVVREFEDSESARSTGRKQFNAMLSFFNAQATVNPADRVRILLVEKTDRLSRNSFDTVDIKRLSMTMGLEVHAISEGSVVSDKSLPSEKFMQNVHSSMAELYSDNLAQQVKKGMHKKASLGYHPTKAPLGYINVHRDNQKLIEPDPLRQQYVKKIFQLMASGKHSIKSLAKFISKDGFRTKRGKEISKSHLQAMFENHTYYGMVDYGGTFCPGKHKGIIDKDLFDKVQKMLRGRSVRYRTERKGDWAFKGLITCGHCGCSVVGEKKVNRKYGGHYVYYHCTGNKGKCPEKYVREEVLVQQFANVVARVQMDDETVEHIKKALLSTQKDKQEFQTNALDALNLRYKALGDMIDRGYEDVLGGFIERDYYAKKKAEWRQEQEAVQTKISQYMLADDSYLNAGLRVLELSKNASRVYESLTLPLKRELLSFVCSNSFWKGGSLTPTYRDPFAIIVHFNENKNAAPAPEGVKNGVSEVWLAD